MLVDKQQHFSVIADTATIAEGIKFVNSPDNELFRNYQRNMATKGKAIAALQLELKTATGKDSAKIISDLNKLDKEVVQYRTDVIKDNLDHPQ